MSAGTNSGAPPGAVLVVEDDPQLRPLVERVLRRAGYRVHLAHNGADALAALREHGASLCAVYLDLTLPDMRGEAVLERVRSLGRALPVVLSSGECPPEGALAAAFLPKPFGPTELCDAIGRAVVSVSATEVPDADEVLTLRCTRADLESLDLAADELRGVIDASFPLVPSGLTREAAALVILRAGLRAHERSATARSGVHRRVPGEPQ